MKNSWELKKKIYRTDLYIIKKKINENNLEKFLKVCWQEMEREREREREKNP